MKIYAHRVNTLEKLARVKTEFGIEIDVRGFGQKMFLNHDPLQDGVEYLELETLLQEYNRLGIQGGIIFNTKEAGYEAQILELAKKCGIKGDSFLLDVEFPYLYAATRRLGVRNIAVRYSEAEPIEAVEAQMVDGQPLLDWVWIDTNTKLPLDAETVKRLQLFKTCLVCPERWGRPNDIQVYVEKMKSLGFAPTAVMTSIEEAHQWEECGL